MNGARPLLRAKRNRGFFSLVSLRPVTRLPRCVPLKTWLWAGLLATAALAALADARNWADPEDAYAAWAAFWALCVLAERMSTRAGQRRWVQTGGRMGPVRYGSADAPGPVANADRIAALEARIEELTQARAARLAEHEAMVAVMRQLYADEMGLRIPDGLGAEAPTQPMLRLVRLEDREGA